MRRFFLERVTDAEIEPVSLTEMKRQLRLHASITTEDDDISAKITAARLAIEHETGRALIDQTWRLTVTDGLGQYDYVQGPQNGIYYTGTLIGQESEILLRRSPVIGISSFVTVDSDGDETAVEAGTYELREADSKWPRIVALNGGLWNSGTYRATFRAGYADRDVSPQQDATVVPGTFKQAIMLYAEALYDRDPKTMQSIIDCALALVRSERCHLDFA